MPPIPVTASSLEPGRYVCLQTPGWMGWIIRKATRSSFNHVVVTGPDGLIVEATPHGVRVTSLSRYANHLACANLDEPMTAAQGLQVWAAAESMVNEPYNWPDLLVLGAEDLGWHWNLLFKVLGSPPWRICSQLVALAGAAAKPPLNWRSGDTYADQVTPAQLALRPGVVPVTIT